MIRAQEATKAKRIAQDLKRLQFVAESVISSYPPNYSYDIGDFTLMAMKIAEEYSRANPELNLTGEEKSAIAKDHIQGIIRTTMAQKVCTEDDAYKALFVLGQLGDPLDSFMKAICTAAKMTSWIQTEHIEAASECIQGCLKRKRKKIVTDTK